jgi:hypothetical protein
MCFSGKGFVGTQLCALLVGVRLLAFMCLLVGGRW